MDPGAPWEITNQVLLDWCLLNVAYFYHLKNSGDIQRKKKNLTFAIQGKNFRALLVYMI